jgi:hypothetical protein
MIQTTPQKIAALSAAISVSNDDRRSLECERLRLSCEETMRLSETLLREAEYSVSIICGSVPSSECKEDPPKCPENLVGTIEWALEKIRMNMELVRSELGRL